MTRTLKNILFFISASILLAFSCISILQSTNNSCPKTKKEGNTNFYAQGFEDYFLAIVFSDVEHGTYIDVGAYDPRYDSVTQYFYNKGWHGINIEPAKPNYQAFIKERPRDINLNVGASDKIDKLTFYRILHTGLSTFDKQIAEKAKRDGFKVKIESVPVTTLNQILAKHHLPVIHFLKIDVEGFEKQVLQGLDLKKYRPYVIMLEATEPRTHIPSYQHWEFLLIKNHYKYALTDGLNRYYVAEEHAHLQQKFSHALNCFLKK